jgi:hypothetical protein
MRKMYKMVDDCVNGVEQVLLKHAKENKEIELKKLMGDYTMDVIACCAFATKIDTHNDPNNLFVKYANRLFQPNIFDFLSLFVFFAVPRLAEKFNISFFGYEACQFFRSAVSFIIYHL